MIVAVNSDRSVRALDKGPNRPVNPAAERAEVLAALACVDATVIFDEDTPAAIVRALQPDVLVKGADWADGTIVGTSLKGKDGAVEAKRVRELVRAFKGSSSGS